MWTLLLELLFPAPDSKIEIPGAAGLRSGNRFEKRVDGAKGTKIKG